MRPLGRRRGFRLHTFENRGCDAQLVHSRPVMLTIVARRDCADRQAASALVLLARAVHPLSENGHSRGPCALLLKFQETFVHQFRLSLRRCSSSSFLGVSRRSGSSPCSNSGAASGPSASCFGHCSRCSARPGHTCTRRRSGSPETWAQLLTWYAIVSFVWSLLTPVVYELARRFPFDRSSWQTALPLHLVACMGVTFVGAAVIVLARSAGDCEPGRKARSLSRPCHLPRR